MIMQRNLKALTDARLLTTIFIGVAAGILGFDGLMGIVFWFATDICVSILMCLRFACKAKPYFKSLRDVFSAGLSANVMTFMVTWVFFHNIVYIL
mgnify:CR=1 FL=1